MDLYKREKKFNHHAVYSVTFQITTKIKKGLFFVVEGFLAENVQNLQPFLIQ